ncbi:hypothetical protein CR513_53021, partial [Mucuna pruriens]
MSLRRSIGEKRNAIPNDYIVIVAMKYEMKYMQDNDVWDLTKLPKGDYKGDVERYKASLVTKGFTQKEGIGYKETFSLISLKDSFKTIMTLVAYFDLELHHMDITTTFLNSDIDETIYMMQ